MAKTTTLTSKGQVTIPVAIREALGLEAHDRIEFVLDGDGARLRKSASKLRDIAGSIPPLRDGRDVEQAILDAREERARKRV